MKNLKKAFSILLILLFSLSIFGCSVNTDKLRNKPVAKVGDSVITKAQLDEMLGLTLIQYYATYSTKIETTDDTVASFKENIIDNLVNTALIDKVSKKYDYSVDKKEVKNISDATYKELKKKIKDSEYTSLLKEYGFKDDSSFKKAIYDYSLMSTKLSGFASKFESSIQGKEYATNTYLEINDIKVPSSVYYYCYINKAMEKQYNDYMKQYSNANSSDTSSQDEEEQTEEEKTEEIKENTLSMIKEKMSYYAAGKEKKLKVSDKEVTTQIATNSSITSMFGSNLSDIYKAYGITKKQYDDAAKMIATADIYKTKLEEDVKVLEVSDSKAKSYFNKNKENYDESTVSVKHILCSDEKTAKEIYKKAKSGTSFDTLMNKYQSSKNVEEAKDLGAITYASVVKEFAKAAFDGDKGEVVGPVKTDYGYHVIYVYDKNDVDTKFENHKDAIKATIKAEEREKEVAKYDKKILKEYKSKILIDDIKQPFDMLIESLKDEYKVKEYKGIIKKDIIKIDETVK